MHLRSNLASLALLCAALSFGSETHADPLAYGHRGGTVLAPESTLATHDVTLNGGADGVELDVWLSSDGIPVVFHDPTLDRTTNGTGLVVDHTLAQLKALDAGSWFSPAFAGEQIPTLAEALALIDGRGKVIIEHKNNSFIPTIAATILASGFDPAETYAWIRLGGQGATAWQLNSPKTKILFGVGSAADFPEASIWQRAELGDHGLIVTYTTLDAEYVELVNSYGLAIFAAVVVSPVFQQMIDIGVDGIVASHPTLLATVLPGAPSECADGIDNDLDGFTDFVGGDASCFSEADKTEADACSDGIDNDLDGLTDFAGGDPGCYGPFSASEAPACSDGIDNNSDGLVDFGLDPGCFATYDQREGLGCNDGLDNDADGSIDLADGGCHSLGDLTEEFDCADGIDNDTDGFTDLADSGCVDALDTSEGIDCSDGLDNDRDGLIDDANDPGCDAPSDPSERSPLLACDDGIDNDLDGGVDFDAIGTSGDLGCGIPSSLTESPECQDGIDNDGQVGTDFDGGVSAGAPPDPFGPDAQCFAFWDTQEAPTGGGVGCGLGPELLAALGLLLAIRIRRGRG